MVYQVEGVDYSPEGIEGIREVLISYRDTCLDQGAFPESVVFTHVIALLANLKERVIADQSQKAKQ